MVSQVTFINPVLERPSRLQRQRRIFPKDKGDRPTSGALLACRGQQLLGGARRPQSTWASQDQYLQNPDQDLTTRNATRNISGAHAERPTNHLPPVASFREGLPACCSDEHELGHVGSSDDERPPSVQRPGALEPPAGPQLHLLTTTSRVRGCWWRSSEER